LAEADSAPGLMWRGQAESEEVARLSSSGKTLGLVLIGAGLAIGIAIAAWAAAAFADGSTNKSGAVLGIVLALIFIVAPLVGGGIFILSKGRAEERDLMKVREQRKLLDIVKTRGQVQVSDLVLELQSTTAGVQSMLVDLVGRGLFSGYVDWNKGVLYSVDAAQLNGRSTCPNCGGQLELAGKGLIKCPYCGAEIFL
jgi:hypothetical protein